MPAQPARSPFHFMTKPIGPICNIACDYCFYLEKEALFEKGEKWRMSDELLETYVRTYIEAQPIKEVSFAWQGGEPTLLGIEFFEKALAFQQKYKGDHVIQNCIQTNGTLLDDDWGKFLSANNFLTGISIDGPRDIHDTYRKDRGGKGSFDRVMGGLESLKKHGAEFNTLTVVNRTNSQRPTDVYKFLKEIGSKYLQFIPLVERQADVVASKLGLSLSSPPTMEQGAMLTNSKSKTEAPVTDWSVRPEDYGNFLCKIFDRWVRRDVGKIYVQQFDAAFSKWLGVPGGICHFSETCGNAMAVEHDGNVYACDHFVYPQYKVGNLMQQNPGEMADSEMMRTFGNAKRDTLPQYCRTCDYLFACNGECPKHRFIHTPDGEPGLNYLCAGYKQFFHHIQPAMEIMGDLYKQQRPPADIMKIAKKQPGLLKQR